MPSVYDTTAVVKERHHGEATRTKWVHPHGVQNTPGPAYKDAYSSIGSQHESERNTVTATAFIKSSRYDIENFPCMGSQKDRQRVKDIINTPGADHYGVVNQSRTALPRAEGGPFNVGRSKNFVDQVTYDKRYVPGPGTYEGAFRMNMPLPNGGQISQIENKGWLEWITEKAHLTPGPTHAYRPSQECLSTKPSESVAFSFPGKMLYHNHQTSLQNSVSYIAETINEQGPNQCRTDNAFNEQMVSNKKNAPSHTFGPKSVSKGALDAHRTKTGARRNREVGREVPRVLKDDDFKKYFGYNPNASQADLDAFYGIKGKNLQDTAPNLCLDYSTKPKAKKRVRRKPRIGPKGQALTLGSRADSFVKFEPTPGPGRYNNTRSLGDQRVSKSKSEASFSFGTD